jgi:prephenate dehydrogenase
MEEIGWRHGIKRASSDGALLDARARIDELDRLISRLLAERLSLVRQLSGLKADLGLPIEDRQREDQVLTQVASSSSDPRISQAIAGIYDAVIDHSRSLQRPEAQPAQASRGAARSEPKRPTGMPHRNYFPRVAIIGLGLIGGALARQIKRSMPQTTVTGVDRTEVLEDALTERLIDAAAPDPQAGIARASLVILAASPEKNIELLRCIAPLLKKRQIVVDVTSTKAEICRLADRLDLHGADFIGGHPLFGSEKSGLAGSVEIDVEGKTFCLVPTARTSEISLKRLGRWLTQLGMRVTSADAQFHDAAVARLSHLVQLVAVALGAELADGRTEGEVKNVLALSGTSFSQIARLMASPPEMWSQIVSQNRQEIVPALGQLTLRLKMIAQAIESGEDTQLAEAFRQARRIPANLA